MGNDSTHVLERGMKMEKKKIIEFKNITKDFEGQVVLKGIDLDIY